MGTNYYKVKTLDDGIKNRLITAIKKDDFKVEDFSTLYFPNIEDIPKNVVHIGKNSIGWKFLFDHNDWEYFKRTEQDLVNWINNPNSGKIVDEGGIEYTADSFWNDIVNPTYTDNKLDSVLYRKKYYRESYQCDICDFYLGKYRIAAYTNFS